MSEEHDWARPANKMWICCKKCGTIKRDDGKNKPCKGEVKVTIRNV